MDANSESIRMTIDEIYPEVRQKLKNKSLTKEDILSAIHELDKKNEEEGKSTLKGLSIRGWMLMGIDTLANYINTKTRVHRPTDAIRASSTYADSWVPDYTQLMAGNTSLTYGNPLRMEYFTLRLKLEQADDESYENARNNMKRFLEENHLHIRENMQPRYRVFMQEMENVTGGRRKRRTRKSRRPRRRSSKQ